MGGGEAEDQANPGKKKEDPEIATAKAASGEALDEANPDKKNPEPDAQQTAKAREGQENTESDGDISKKAEESEDDTYDLATVQRAIKAIEKIGKAEDETDEKTTKEASETDEETTKSTKIASIDRFVISVASALEILSLS